MSWRLPEHANVTLQWSRASFKVSAKVCVSPFASLRYPFVQTITKDICCCQLKCLCNPSQRVRIPSLPNGSLITLMSERRYERVLWDKLGPGRDIIPSSQTLALNCIPYPKFWNTISHYPTSPNVISHYPRKKSQKISFAPRCARSSVFWTSNTCAFTTLAINLPLCNFLRRRGVFLTWLWTRRVPRPPFFSSCFFSLSK